MSLRAPPCRGCFYVAVDHVLIYACQSVLSGLFATVLDLSPIKSVFSLPCRDNNWTCTVSILNTYLVSILMILFVFLLPLNRRGTESPINAELYISINTTSALKAEMAYNSTNSIRPDNAYPCSPMPGIILGRDAKR